MLIFSKARCPCSNGKMCASPGQGAKHTDMGAGKGVFSRNLPGLGRDLLLRAPHPTGRFLSHPTGRFLSPRSSVWECFGAFPRRRFHLCYGRVSMRVSTRFELESNRDRKAGRIRPRRARAPHHAPTGAPMMAQPTIHATELPGFAKLAWAGLGDRHTGCGARPLLHR